MAGIYIHVPFCKKACHYCNFHFSTSINQLNDFIVALCKEIELQRNYINEKVDTIYFGGGTPSLLKAQQVETILKKLHEVFDIDNDAEITLEANPDDIDDEKLNHWKQLGINRLSIGVQSFYNEDLQWMNRAHSSAQALNSMTLANQKGFHLTIDLIYGTPTLSDEHWRTNVEKAIELGVHHLSCYALTVEPRTALEKMIAQKKTAPVDIEKQAHQFELLMQWMQDAGYVHYEISNFAKPGFESRHNSSYWQGKPYLGIGPSAHSFNGNSRKWNVANNALYIQNLMKNILVFESEHLTSTQQLNEYIMTSLRTAAGLSLQMVEEKWSKEEAENIARLSRKYIQQQAMMQAGTNLQLTAKGKLLADGIAADLFT